MPAAREYLPHRERLQAARRAICYGSGMGRGYSGSKGRFGGRAI